MKVLEPPTSPARMEPSPSVHELTLLVVDDEVAPRRTLRLLFEQNYRVLEAADGYEALEILRTQTVHAAILDLRMPGMTGIELLERIKADFGSVQVLILTAYESLETAKQALRLGALDYLNKPFSLEVIRKAVSRAFERQGLEAQRQMVGRKVEELNQSIEAQRLKEQMLKERGEIYASVIHDLNGPLTVIASFAETLSRQIEVAPSLRSEDWQDFREKFQRLQRQAGNCVHISRRYLGFLRDQDPGGSVVGLNQTLADLRDLLAGTPYSADHDFAVQATARDASVRIHGTDLLQVLLNLAINALQSKEEPHRVAVTCEIVPADNLLPSPIEGEGERWVRGEKGLGTATHFASVSVHDDGAGIGPAHLGRLFKDSFTTKPPGVGTGLGLLIVRRLVLEVGGMIHVRSRPGVGTCISVFLPCDPALEVPSDD